MKVSIFRSLRFRLLVLYLFLIVAAMTALGVQVYRWSASDLLSERRVRLLTEGRIAADSVSPLLGRGAGAVASSLDSLARRFGSRLLFVDTTRRVEADSLELSTPADSLVGTTVEFDEVLAALEGREETGVYRLASGEFVMYASAPVVRQGNVVGSVLVSGSLEALVDTLDTLARRLLYAGAAISAVFLIVTWVVAAYLTSPLGALTAAARKLGSGELATRVDVRTGDEVGQLADTFNHMAAQLEEHDQAQRRFLADASHELRSPVSSSIMLVEALEADLERDQPLLVRLKEQLDRMSRLVGQLMELARLEEWQAEELHGAGPPPGEEPQYADLAHIISRVVRRLAPLAGAAGVELIPDLDGHPVVAATEESLERVMQNLVENGIKYTDRGGQVTVGAHPATGDQEQITAWVADTGVGIQPEDLAHIFDRFYRADPSRSRERGGFGLGLAIVRRRVEAMGGSITVESTVGEGTRFELLLPAFVQPTSR